MFKYFLVRKNPTDVRWPRHGSLLIYVGLRSFESFVMLFSIHFLWDYVKVCITTFWTIVVPMSNDSWYDKTICHQIRNKYNSSYNSNYVIIGCCLIIGKTSKRVFPYFNQGTHHHRLKKEDDTLQFHHTYKNLNQNKFLILIHS